MARPAGLRYTQAAAQRHKRRMLFGDGQEGAGIVMTVASLWHFILLRILLFKRF